ncbi:MAG: START domain-containing protein [Cyclobacteriaceae bacterium]
MLSKAQADEQWVLEKQKKGIAVHTRIPAGERFKEFKATATINSSVESIVALLLDTEAAPQWYNHIESAKIIQQITDAEGIVYFHLNLPFPVTDRDMVSYVKYSYDSITGEVRSIVESRHDAIPRHNKVIRIEKIYGSWSFKPIEPGKTELVYQYFTDPKGNIPAWAVNMFIVDEPFKSLENMREFVQQEKYQKAQVSFMR